MFNNLINVFNHFNYSIPPNRKIQTNLKQSPEIQTKNVKIPWPGPPLEPPGGFFALLSLRFGTELSCCLFSGAFVMLCSRIHDISARCLLCPSQCRDVCRIAKAAGVQLYG